LVGKNMHESIKELQHFSIKDNKENEEMRGNNKGKRVISSCA